ncbi:MAG: hypothetical protein K2N12_00445 [Helicobacter sp.]|nr:hypothetical protein [Helicobacter sp.]
MANQDVIASLHEAINDSILPDFVDCFGHTLAMTFLFGGATLVALIIRLCAIEIAPPKI